jgi:pyruvate/2-oxoglutarate dehydrogenase complex dihydrolipoamide acyltransferase (E2) component
VTEKQTEALEKLNRGIQESRQEVQQRTMSLAQEYFGDSAEVLKQQIKENRATLKDLPDQIPGGRDEVFQALFQELMDNYSAMEESINEAQGNVANLDTDQIRRQGEVEATDAARRQAKELGIDLTQIEGTGADGRIIVSDVVEAAEAMEDGANGQAEQVAEQAQDAAGQATDQAGQVAGQAQEAAGGAAQQAQDTVGQAAEQAQDAAGQATGQAQQVAGQATDQAGQVAGQAQEAVGGLTGGGQQGDGQGGGGPLGGVTDQVGQVAQGVQDTAGQATGQAQQVAGQATDQAGQVAGQAQEAAGGAAQQAQDTAGQAAQQGQQAAGDGAEEPRATNAARRRARELGVDLSTLEGTGSGGLITIQDVVGS